LPGKITGVIPHQSKVSTAAQNQSIGAAQDEGMACGVQNLLQIGVPWPPNLGEILAELFV
jgi:hypothetical protein